MIKQNGSKIVFLLKEYNKMKYHYILILPVLVYFLLFHYFPMYGVIIAFKDYNIVSGIMASPWNGFINFERLFSSPIFLRVFRNTIIISAYRIIWGFPAPIIFALLINEVRNMRFKKLVQSISYLPHFISWVVLAGIFIQILSPSTGIINYLISLFGLEPIHFLAESQYFRTVIVASSIWQGIGYGSIVYLAAISSIDQQIYEASYIDGASRFQQAIRITIPSILPVILILLILRTGRVMNAGFEQIFNLYNPLVYEVGDIIDTYVYRIGLLRYDYGFATAVGLFKNVVGLLFVLSTNFLAKRFGDYGIW